MNLERSEQRDAALRAALIYVPELGWTRGALRAGLADLGEDPEAAETLFPRCGGAALVEAWTDLADRDMAAAAAPLDLQAMRVPDRIRALIALRLERAGPHRDAVRRAVAVLALPWNAGAAARTAGRTADAMWHAAGDRSADFSWYTRRATLAAIYGVTLAYWLREPEPLPEEVAAFLDRRLDMQARLGRLRRRAA